MSITIPQGADATIRVSGIVDGADAPLDVTGWTVVAQLRRRPGAPLLAEWATGPTAGQGEATTGADGVILAVPAAMSQAWTWRGVAVLHVEVHEPVGDQRQARVGETTLYLDPAIVA